MSQEASVPGVHDAPIALLQLMTGYWVSQSLYVVAKLGVADVLAGGPLGADDLAAATGAHAPSLYRVLRALASVNVFTQELSGRFGLAPMSELLCTDRVGSMRPLAVMYGEEQYRAWGDALYSVRTGEKAFDHQFGMDYFAYLREHPDSDRVLNEAMTGLTTQLAGAVAACYDFSSFDVIVDVGGGYGTMLKTILECAPGSRGVLFDQPHVVADAEARLFAAGLGERCSFVGGDFFVDVPAGGDAYVLSQVLHDWDDEASREILSRCRRAIPSQGKLLVVEFVLPDDDEPFVGKWVDLHMLILNGGRERTSGDFEGLFRSTGFEFTRAVPTMVGHNVIEAKPA
jgi:O-methyltransferase domain/Dimerisation domain